MSQRELWRVEVLARVRSQQLRGVDAASLLGLSYRQAKRLWKRYREEGAAGLKHRSAGRPSHHAYEPKFRRTVLRLVREKYGGAVGERFGPTLAAEHLASEDGLRLDAETLRRWMLAEGLWSRERKRRRPPTRGAKEVPASITKRRWVPPAELPWRQTIRREVQKRALATRPSLALPCASP